MSKYYPKLYEQFGKGIKTELDPSDYATKADNKNI